MNQIPSASTASASPKSYSAANIVKEGWLYKRGERIKNWRPR